MAAVILCTPHMPTNVSPHLNIIWLQGCCHSVHNTHAYKCVTLLLERHLAAWLLSFCAHRTRPKMCRATSSISFGCMAAAILCTPDAPKSASPCSLNIIWLHGCCHSVHTTHSYKCVTLLLEHHLAAWLLSSCAHHTCPRVHGDSP